MPKITILMGAVNHPQMVIVIVLYGSQAFPNYAMCSQHLLECENPL